MEVKCIWKIKLPFRFDIEEGTELERFIIEDILILPIKLKGSQFYDSIDVEYETTMDDELVPKDKYVTSEMIGFKREITRKVGFKVNRFINSYYRLVENNIINQVFNGDDFTTLYEMAIFNKKGESVDNALYTANSGVRVINQQLIEEIINDINVKERDIVNEFMRISTCFLENGYFEMAIMNLSMVLEAFIKSVVLSKVKVQNLNEAYGYLDKFFHVGLKKTIGFSLKENEPDYYEIVSIITASRNQISHGSSIYNLEEFKELNETELYDYIDDLIIAVEDILELIKEEMISVNGV